MNKNTVSKKFIFVLISALAFVYSAKLVFAQANQEGQSSPYVPLIGITSVPEPLILPDGPGNVTYYYAVKNFLREISLTNIVVSDNKCSAVKFIDGDVNNNLKLDYDETWRYACTVKISDTTQSIATVFGNINNIYATHKAYATVVVGSNKLPPLISIVNVTKVDYPLYLPIEGGDIDYTYKVINLGVTPLSEVVVKDNKCDAMSGELGDKNGNDLLDPSEVWIYTCKTKLTETTTSTATATAFSNGFEVVGEATLTVIVETPSPPEAGVVLGFSAQSISSFLLTVLNVDIKSTVLGTLFGILIILAFFYFPKKLKNDLKNKLKLIVLIIFSIGIVGAGYYFVLKPKLNQNKPIEPDKFFGWKFPVVKFPVAGPELTKLAYSSIRVPGGLPQGLPVRLKIPAIGVDTAIEDALITIDGRMDVPQGSVNVAWFALGPNPGDEGSAVIGGHFGINNGVKFVFYDLDKLKIGDNIYIVDDEYKTIGFVVRSIKLFDSDDDTADIFTSHDGLAHLNLITCEGIWNAKDDTYPERRVIFTDAIREGAVPTSIVPRRELRVGSRGADVLELQDALEQKGFLVMPREVAKGYFGALTQAAVIQYQASVGLPTDGVLDALTRSKLFAAAIANPALPLTAITPPKSLSNFQVFIQSAKSLFVTPIDWFIASLLFVVIGFAAFKFFRR